MYELLKKHKRNLLAVATALLMVAFLLPTMQGGGGGENRVLGRAAGKKLQVSDLRQSQYRYQLLRQKLLVPGMNGQAMPALVEMLGSSYPLQQMERHPEMFWLLVQEARNQGVYVSDETLSQWHERLIPSDLDMRRPDIVAQVNAALREGLMVQEMMNRMMTAIRVSKPASDYYVAIGAQRAALSAVDFKAADFEKGIAQPTQEQMQAQFAKYKEVLPATPMTTANKDNPYGFGYKYPDRAQVQFVGIPVEEVRKHIEAGKSAADWTKEAWKEYLKNPKRYSATTRPAGATQPTVYQKPFKEVEQDALDAAIMPEVDRLAAAIVGRVNSVLSTDWQAFKDAPAGQAPVSSMGVAFDSYAYLEKLAERVEKEFGVRITIGHTGTLADEYQLQNLKGVSQTRTPAGVPFAPYVLLTEGNRKAYRSQYPALPQPLVQWQASQSLHTDDKDTYFFRRSEFSPEHSPANLAEVSAKVESDVKLVAAMAKAKEAAQAFINRAKADGLTVAAAAEKRQLVDIDPQSPIAMGLHLTDVGNEQFFANALPTLLTLRAADEPTPVAAIEVPRDGRVIVTRLNRVVPMWQPGGLPMVETRIEGRLIGQWGRAMYRDWFSYANVVKRMKYVPTNPSTRPSDDDSDAAGEDMGF